MARFFHPLILMLASLGKSELARHIQYLKAENEILRAKLPKRAAEFYSHVGGGVVSSMPPSLSPFLCLASGAIVPPRECQSERADAWPPTFSTDSLASRPRP